MSEEFFEAIKQGNLEEVKRLLASNPKWIHEKENGLSPVLLAAHRGHAELADFLADKAGALSVFECAATGRLNRLSQLLARDPLLVNAYSEDGFQPLALACLCGQYEAAEYLVKAGASVNSPTRNGQNAAPLQLAVAGGYFKIVSLLLDYDADPNVRDANGWTPLHVAAQNGYEEIIRVLLFNGANLLAAGADGKLPIDIAVAAGRKQAAALLKEGVTRRFRARKLK